MTQYALSLELNVSMDTIKYRIRKLKKAGIIKHSGPTKAGKWIVL